MNLAPCRACGQPVATGAPGCPRCGQTWPTGKPTTTVDEWLKWAVAALAFVVLAYIAWQTQL